MCGIAGIINLDGAAVDKDLLGRMSSVLRHRGPEGEGLYTCGNVGLAHRRLKIIDLSDNGNQPMFNEKSDIVLVYNGQIYNYIELRAELSAKGHTFRSKSDSETILHAYEEWGNDCQSHFTGMWAFAIWDTKNKTLFMSRDRLGIKPLYYFFDGHVFLFASEIKAILENSNIERKANRESIYEYLQLGYTLGSKTWFKEISKLEPAHSLCLDHNGGITKRRFWDVSSKPDYSLGYNGAVKLLKPLLHNSVKLMLRSDVEVASHLSGGIDSSTVTILAGKFALKGLKTFTGIFREGPEFDESRYVDDLLRRYHFENNKIIVNHDDFLGNLRKIIWHMDEPTAGAGAYPLFFVSRLINSHKIKVVLGGEGGDELFAGYPHYYSGLLNSIFNGGDFKYKHLSFKAVSSYLRRFISKSAHIRMRYLNNLLSEEFKDSLKISNFESSHGFYTGSVENMQSWDLHNYLPALLKVEDNIGMAWSVEARFPLLHHELVEYAFSLPYYYKLNRRYKCILREAMREELPRSIYERKDKKGFPTPVKIWLKEGQLAGDVLSEINGKISCIFRDKNISWEKLNIGLWSKIFKAEI